MNDIKELLIYKKYCKDKDHACEVRKYCKMIISALKNGTQSYKDITPQQETYLEIAALLHDIGYVTEKKSHHKHSMELILKEKLENYSDEEIKIIANIARYHRGSFPDENKHPRFAELADKDKNIVQLLASVLRLADGLDKPHKNLVLRMRANETADSINLYLKTIGFKPNLKMAEKKKDLFEHILQKKINLLFE